MRSALTYNDVLEALSNAGVPTQQLHGSGHLAVIPAAGRIIGLAFSAESPNLLWTNPQLTHSEIVTDHPERLIGGLGGDRLWFGPELDYHWDGPPRWDTLVNYHVPSATDPGEYAFQPSGPGAIALHAAVNLKSYRDGGAVSFEVERQLRLVAPPFAPDDAIMRGVDYVGIETSHALKLNERSQSGRVDLWHLLQAPAGSQLLVPLKSDCNPADRCPLSYGLSGSWIEEHDHIRWRYGSNASAKFGLAEPACTGRSAILQELGDGKHCLIVRQFDVAESGTYGDHPAEASRSDQVLQAWDGLGFGEMEYHSPVLSTDVGPREIRESDFLWAFGGSWPQIKTIAKRLLGIDVGR